MKLNAKAFIVAPVALLMLFVTASPAGADEEFHGFGVNLFEAANECCGTNSNDSCSSQDLTYAWQQADELEDVFDGWITAGYWNGETREYANAAVDPADFTDPDEQAWGGDNVDIYAIDDADVAYVSSHGGQICNTNAPNFASYIRMGQVHSGQDCSPDTKYSARTDDEMLVGDTDLEIMIVDACNSTQKCVWAQDGYDYIDGAELLMWAGFHGLSFDRSGQVTALTNYASNSRTSGVGDNWIDYRYEVNYSGTDDQCPGVIIWGSSGTNTDNMYNNGGLDDWIATGTHTMATFYYVGGCDPADGEAM